MISAVKTLISVFILMASLSAQTISPGTALPVTLSTDLNAKKIQAGQTIVAEIAQKVPLASGVTIRAGSRVSGRVLQENLQGGRGSRLRIKFDAVTVNGRELPITTSLRALASPVEVQNAELPIHGPISAETAATATTVQIGGDDVYRGGGHVMHGDRVVGDPVAGGVLAELIPVPESGCPNGSGGRRLALWLFSSSVCGSYGVGKLAIVHPGDKIPIGEIVLQHEKNVHVRKGSAMLLITTEAPERATAP
jgi:hypothetical protein